MSSFTLSDGSTTITLYPDWNFKDKLTMLRSDHRTMGQGLISFKWCAYSQYEFKLDMVSLSDGGNINAWWEAGTALSWTVNGVRRLVKIINTSTPLLARAPFVEYLGGKLQLGATEPIT